MTEEISRSLFLNNDIIFIMILEHKNWDTVPFFFLFYKWIQLSEIEKYCSCQVE